LSPSDLGGAKALAGEDGADEEDAKSYGSFVHRLLETLPGIATEGDAEIARNLGLGFDPAHIDTALTEARSVLDKPENAYLFAVGTLAEVPVTATLHGRRIHGTIDRLVITEKEIVAVDYKTNRVVPATVAECPDGLLRQMGAYAGALAQIFPDHRISTAILWTRTGALMSLPHDLVTKALASAHDLDVTQARS
jgi:ATP-dependent helicase/nuclease subunit A